MVKGEQGSCQLHKGVVCCSDRGHVLSTEYHTSLVALYIVPWWSQVNALECRFSTEPTKQSHGECAVITVCMKPQMSRSDS